jgi:hypothetical protein
MSARRYLLAVALVIGLTTVATIGWLEHWNAYVNLMLTLGTLGIYATAIVAIHTGSPSGKERP